MKLTLADMSRVLGWLRSKYHEWHNLQDLADNEVHPTIGAGFRAYAEKEKMEYASLLIEFKLVWIATCAEHDIPVPSEWESTLNH